MGAPRLKFLGLKTVRKCWKLIYVQMPIDSRNDPRTKIETFSHIFVVQINWNFNKKRSSSLTKSHLVARQGSKQSAFSMGSRTSYAFWTRWNSLCEMAFERIDSVRKNIKSVETVPQILLGINETVFWAPFTGFCSWFSSERSADCNGCRWTDSVQQKEPPRHNRLYYRSVATVRQRLNVCPDQRMPKVIWSWLNWVNCNSRDCKINFVILTVGMLKGGLWNLFIARLGKSLTWSQSARQVTAVIWP